MAIPRAMILHWSFTRSLSTSHHRPLNRISLVSSKYGSYFLQCECLGQWRRGGRKAEVQKKKGWGNKGLKTKHKLFYNLISEMPSFLPCAIGLAVYKGRFRKTGEGMTWDPL